MNNDIPEFPETAFPYTGKVYPESPGMFLRDYFAAKAMQAIRTQHQKYAESILAKEAYAIADAMMAQRFSTVAQ